MMTTGKEIIKLLIKYSNFRKPEYRDKFSKFFLENCTVPYSTIEDLISEKTDVATIHEDLEKHHERINKTLKKKFKQRHDPSDLETLHFAYSIIGYYLCHFYNEQRYNLPDNYTWILKTMDVSFFTAYGDFHFLNHTKNEELKDLLKKKITIHTGIAKQLWEKDKSRHYNVRFRYHRAALIYLLSYYSSSDKRNLPKAKKYVNETKRITMNAIKYIKEGYFYKIHMQICNLHRLDVLIDKLIMEEQWKECKINKKYENCFPNPREFNLEQPFDPSQAQH